MIAELLAKVVGVPETRSTEQVRREVDEEFSHHQECLRDELRRLGVPESELEARVAERFGDAERVKVMGRPRLPKILYSDDASRQPTTNECVFSMTRSEYLKGDGKDLILRPGDLVEVP